LTTLASFSKKRPIECNSVENPQHDQAQLQRDQGVKEALARPAGRPLADPRDRENARLRQENERLQAELSQGPQGDRGAGKALRARDRLPPGDEAQRRALTPVVTQTTLESALRRER